MLLSGFIPRHGNFSIYSVVAWMDMPCLEATRYSPFKLLSRFRQRTFPTCRVLAPSHKSAIAKTPPEAFQTRRLHLENKRREASWRFRSRTICSGVIALQMSAAVANLMDDRRNLLD